MKATTDIGTLKASRSQFELWKKDDSLARQWAQGLPALSEFFDADFFTFVENQGVKYGYGFVETLAAIVLYHATGYLPMLSTHNFYFSESKEEIVESLMPCHVIDVIRAHTKDVGRTQAPDLLMYRPELDDWFFCEVKGARDELGDKQRLKIKAIFDASKKPVRLLHFKWAKP